MTVEISPKLLFKDLAETLDCSVQYIHKMAKDKNVIPEKAGNRNYINGKEAQKLLAIKIPKKVISIQTSKGGVGKTTVCQNLAVRLWSYGAKVLLIDLDQQSNLTRTFIKDRPSHVFIDILEEKIAAKDTLLPILDGLSILPSSIKNAILNQHMVAYGLERKSVVKDIVNHFVDDFDIIIIDCPPAIGPIVSSSTYASDMVISPIDPDEYALEGMKYCHNEIKRFSKENNSKIEFKILLNKYDARTILSSGIAQQLQSHKDFGKCLFSTILSTSTEFINARTEKRSIFDSYKQGRACKEIDSLTREILSWPVK